MGNRYKKLVKIVGIKWSKECPVLLIKGALLHDDAEKQNLLQLKFQSITNNTLVGVEIEYKAYSIGDELLLEEKFSYLDLNVNLNNEFGEKTAIYLQSSDARKFSFLIKKVFFSNGEIWESNEVLQDINSQCPIKNELGDLYDQFQREYRAVSSHEKAEYLPIMGEYSWQCSCGSLNLGNFAVCRCCGIKKENLLKILDKDYLWKENEKFQIEEQRRREKEEMENAERRANEKILREKKKRKKKKVISAFVISSVVAVAVILLFCGVVNVIIPNVKYSQAKQDFESGNYEAAVEKFEGLKEYKDSAERLVESRYFYACKKYDEKMYMEAQKVFSEIDSYKDSADYLEKCTDYITYNKAKDFYGKGDYSGALDLLESLPKGFEDSEKLKKTYALAQGELCFADKNYKMVLYLYEKYGIFNDTYMETCYQSGILCKKSKEYNDAINFFEKCEKYRDALEQKKWCIYEKAIESMGGDGLDEAIKLYDKLGNYKKSKKFKKICKANRKYSCIWKSLDDDSIMIWKVSISRKGKVSINDNIKIHNSIATWYEGGYFNTFNMVSGRRIVEKYYDGKKYDTEIYKYKLE